MRGYALHGAEHLDVFGRKPVKCEHRSRRIPPKEVNPFLADDPIPPIVGLEGLDHPLFRPAVHRHPPDAGRIALDEVQMLPVVRFCRGEPPIRRERSRRAAVGPDLPGLPGAAAVGSEVDPTAVSGPARSLVIRCLRGQPRRYLSVEAQDVYVRAAFFLGHEGEPTSVRSPARGLRKRSAERRKPDRSSAVALAHPDLITSAAVGDEGDSVPVGRYIRIGIPSRRGDHGTPRTSYVVELASDKLQIPDIRLANTLDERQSPSFSSDGGMMNARPFAGYGDPRGQAS